MPTRSPHETISPDCGHLPEHGGGGLRLFAVIAGVGFLSGGALYMVQGLDQDHRVRARQAAVSAEWTARRDLAARDYQVIALDPKSRLACPAGTTAFEFTAVRDHRLLAGGVCVPAEPTGRPSLIVALPPLR